MRTPEQKARQGIDRMLAMAGWDVRDMDTFDLSAARGVVILLLAEALRERREGLKPRCSSPPKTVCGSQRPAPP